LTQFRGVAPAEHGAQEGLTMNSEIWEVRLSVAYSDTDREIVTKNVEIAPPFGIKKADAEVKAIKEIQRLHPVAWVGALGSTFLRIAPTVEPIPDACMPFNGDPEKLADFLAGPKIDANGKIVGGLFHGMTQAEVLADRDAYNRATGGDGRIW
jgi:hypothetical protein